MNRHSCSVEQRAGSAHIIGRYYDPATAQFLSVDPDVAQTGQPYAYTAIASVRQKRPDDMMGS